MELQSTHALFAAGRRRICCTPGRSGVVVSENVGESLDASIYDGASELSDGSGGICTKCRISEADVPTYRLLSVAS